MNWFHFVKSSCLMSLLWKKRNCQNKSPKHKKRTFGRHSPWCYPLFPSFSSWWSFFFLSRSNHVNHPRKYLNNNLLFSYWDQYGNITIIIRFFIKKDSFQLLPTFTYFFHQTYPNTSLSSHCHISCCYRCRWFVHRLSIRHYHHRHHAICLRFRVS